jgi:peptide/nickel transport system substrate-binding protein
VKVQTGKALIAAVAATALAVTACSSSGGGTSNTSTGAPPPPASSGAPAPSGSSSSTTSQPQGTKGTFNFTSCGSDPLNCNTGTANKGGTVTYTIEKPITGWNLNNANSNTFDFAEVLDGVLPGAFTALPNLKPVINKDVMVSATQTKTNPQTLLYKIKPNAVWDDGVPVNFADFKYAKDTSDGTTCPKCLAASTSGYNQIKTMTSADNGKTITVVMKTPFADWQSMFGTLYPAHIAAKHGGTSGAAGLAKSFNWFDANVPNYPGASAGPYEITGYQKNTSVTESPNPKWYGAVKPSLDKLVFRIITDQTQEVPALQNNEVQAIYPQPSSDIVDQANQIQGVQTYLGKGLTWEHLDFNEANPVLKDKALRTAIFTAISRKDIIDRTVGQFVPGIQPLGSHMYVPGQPGYQDNVTSTGQGSGDVAKAKQMLTSAGYTGVGTALKNKSGQAVNLRCTFTTGNTLRQQTCQIIQSELQQLGIKVTPTPTADLGGALEKGDFDLIIFAWVGTPFVVAGAQQIWELKGGADYGKNNDPAEEKLINKAAQQTDQTKVQTLLNQADKLLTADAYVLPLFPKPTFLAAYQNIVNLRDNATSVGPPYNVQAWGLKS